MSHLNDLHFTRSLWLEHDNKMLKTFSIILLVFSNFSYAETNQKMYSCIENKNKLYVSFNHNNKTAMVGMGEQKKYSIQIDFIYWDTVSYQNNDTLLSSIIFHKPSGRMSVNTYNSKLKNKKMTYYQCTLIK